MTFRVDIDYLALLKRHIQSPTYLQFLMQHQLYLLSHSFFPCFSYHGQCSSNMDGTLEQLQFEKNSLFHGYRLKADTQWSCWQEFNAGPKHASHSNSLFNLRMSMAGKNRHLKNCSYQQFLYFAAVKAKDIHVCTTCGLHVSMP